MTTFLIIYGITVLVCTMIIGDSCLLRAARRLEKQNKHKEAKRYYLTEKILCKIVYSGGIILAVAIVGFLWYICGGFIAFQEGSFGDVILNILTSIIPLILVIGFLGAIFGR